MAVGAVSTYALLLIKKACVRVAVGNASLTHLHGGEYVRARHCWCLVTYV